MEGQTLSDQQAYLDEVNSGLENLWDTAKRIVEQALSFQPDVVVCLMHSGWVPLRAAMQLWEATQAGPFPAVARTNLGREKLALYRESPKEVRTGEFLGIDSDPFQTSHFLAWLSQQGAWQAELKGQMQAQLGSGQAPRRIMVVDDWIAEGSTCILALGLLEATYPGAQVHFVAGALGWKSRYDWLWLKLFHAELFERVNSSRDEDGNIDGEMRQLVSCTQRLMLGTEDLAQDSLEWRPVTAGSAYLNRISQFLPQDEWLELPQFVEKTTRDYIAERIQAYLRGVTLEKPGERGLFPALSLEVLVLRDLWLIEGGISMRDISQKYQLSRGQAAHLVRKMTRRGLLVKTGRNRSTRYRLPPDAYLEHEQLKKPLLETYWVVPGQLLVGDSPRYLREAELRTVLCDLLEKGIDYFLDMSNTNGDDLEIFRTTLQAEAAGLAKEVAYQALSLPGRVTPPVEVVKSILDAIDQARAGGYTVYAGCNELDKQSGLVAGCYLARHGLGGKQALAEVAKLRAGTASWWLPAPGRESLRRLVRGWQVGE